MVAKRRKEAIDGVPQANPRLFDDPCPDACDDRTRVRRGRDGGPHRGEGRKRQLPPQRGTGVPG